MKRIILILVVLGVVCAAWSSVSAQEVLFVYGPGGPYPAMREAAEAFGQARNAKIEVVAGPTGTWLQKAKADADVIFSGAEYMMTDFIGAMGGQIDETTVMPLYLRPSAILVRPGNPKKIAGFEDLLKPGTKVLVVQGAGQTGLWEDMAGKKGDLRTVRTLRQNIVAYAANSAEAKKRWTEDAGLDAWLIWNIWQVANPTLADLVPVGEEYVLYRDCGVALTQRGKDKPLARAFVEFLQSAGGARIFAKWGWMTPGAK